MSAEATLVTARHFEYLTERTADEGDYLRQLKQAAGAAGIPAIWISPGQASLMQILLSLCGARRVVEVGTLAGYSAIAMARALPAGGHVDTIELLDRHADFAEAWIARSDVAGRVRVHRGAGLDVLPRLEDGAYDAAFLDADKSNYPGYLQHSLRLVRPGGLIMVDNTFSHGRVIDAGNDNPLVIAVRNFNDHAAADDRVDLVMVPIGDGLTLARKRD